MKFILNRENVALEDSFGDVVLDVAEKRLQILGAIYASVNPTYSLAASDLRAVAGDTVASVVISVVAFGGSAQVEISPERFRAVFTGLRSVEDLSTILRFTSLVDEAVREYVPIERVSTRKLQRQTYLATEEPGFNAAEFIEGLLSDRGRVDLKALGASASSYTYERTLSSQDGLWSTSLLFQQSVDPGASIFVAHSTTYQNPIPEPRACLEDSDNKLRLQLAAYDIELNGD